MIGHQDNKDALSHQHQYTIHGQDLIVARTSNNNLAFLRRNLASCLKDIKTQCYQTLVQLILEYASTSWDPYTETNIQRLELDQRRAARFVIGTTDPPAVPKQQLQSYDCWPWMGTSKPAKSQRQTGHGIQNHIWAHLHPSVTVSASSNIEHQRSYTTLPATLLHDRCLWAFISPSAIRL